MLPEALLTHKINGRVRLQIASERRNEAYFKRLESKLAEYPAVSKLKTNALTGSVLVLHRGRPEEIVRFAQENGLFRLVEDPAPATPLLASVAASAGRLDQRLRSASRGNLDIATLAFLGCIAVGVVRIAGGSVFPAGLTLFWYASGLLPPRPAAPQSEAPGPEERF